MLKKEKLYMFSLYMSFAVSKMGPYKCVHQRVGSVLADASVVCG